MKYRTITTTKTIIAQIDIFFRNTFKFEFDEIKPGSTNIKTKIWNNLGRAHFVSYLEASIFAKKLKIKTVIISDDEKIPFVE